MASQATGQVLEIAVGTARNLSHYPNGVRLTGIDVSPAMLALGRRRAADLSRAVDLRLGDAQALQFPDASFDTIVSTLSLCSIPDDARAVSEARRVLRHGGRFLLLEHVRSPYPIIRILQCIIEPLFRWLGGDHLLREPLDRLRAEGFEVERVERSKWGIVERVRARKPV